MAKFIELTQKSSGEPISLNLDAVQSLKPGRNEGTHIQFVAGGDQLYVVVDEPYDEVIELIARD